MKNIFNTLILSLLTTAFISINNPCKAINLLVETTTNDTLITTNKLANTAWKVIKHDRLSKDKKEYKEFVADPNNVVSYTFKNDNTCVVTNGPIAYDCTWVIKNNSIIITENTEHNVFTFYVKNISATQLIMIGNYKANQETIILLSKIK